MAERVASPELVGREAEVAALDSALAQLAVARTRTVLVAGEAGVGKTRLVGEFAARAAAAGARALTGACVALGAENLPFAPFTQALGELAADLGPAGVEALVGPGRADLARLVPELRTAADDLRATDGTDRAVLFQVVVSALEGLGATAPVVLVIEDLHWADASSRELFGFLLRRLRGPVLMVATYRADEVHRSHRLRPLLAEAGRDERVRRIDLAPLTPAQVTEQVTGILGARPRQELVDAVVSRAEGNPFFAEELVAAGAGPDLPPTLADILATRLAALPEEAQEIVRIAAVAGRQVSHNLLAAVAGRPEADLVPGLRAATAHHVLVGDPTGAYVFRHALLQEAAYAELLPGERVPLHAAYARVLSAHPEWSARSSGAAGELAHHYAAAHDLSRALRASVDAAGAAAASYAFAEAHAFFEQALELWDRVPEAAELTGGDRPRLLQQAADAAELAGDTKRAVALVRAAIEEIDTIELARGALLQECLARLLWKSGDGEASLRASRAAVELMPSEPSVERAQVLGGEARALLLAARYQEAAARAREAVEVARVAGARREEGYALNSLGASLGRLGQAEEAVALLEEALAIAEEVGSIEDVRRAYNNLSATLHDAAAQPAKSAAVALQGATRLEALGYAQGAISLRGAATMSLVAAGDWDEVERLAADVMAGTTDGLTGWRARLAAGSVALRRGDFATAHVHLEEARRLRLGSKNADYLGMLAIALAELAIGEGRAADVRQVVDDCLTALRGTEAQDYVWELAALGLRVEADHGERRGREGDARRSRERSERLVAQAEETGGGAAQGDLPPGRIGLALRSLCGAELSRVRGESSPEAWARAAEGWVAAARPYEEAYARWRLAEALLGAGDKDAAVAALRQARATAARLGAGPVVADIEALARRARVRIASEADARPAPSAASHLGLTARETEVLALVAAGYTNHQIAEALFMSEKTASVHVSRILAKLGVATRGQAGALAHRLELFAGQTPP